MHPIPHFTGEINLAEYLKRLEGAVSELQAMAVQNVQSPLWKSRGTLGASLPTNLRWGVVAADWDVNALNSWVKVNPVPRPGAGEPDTSQTIYVQFLWPTVQRPDWAGGGGTIAMQVDPGYWRIKAGLVIPYLPSDSYFADPPEGATGYGVAWDLWRTPVWGKLTADWASPNNYVTVRLCDEDGTEIGFTANVKCWLFSPESLASVLGVNLHAGDLIRLEVPTWNGVGQPEAHAINVPSGGVSPGADESMLITRSGSLLWLPHGADNKIIKMVAGAIAWGDAPTPAAIFLLDGSQHKDTVNGAAEENAMIIGRSGGGVGGIDSWTKLLGLVGEGLLVTNPGNNNKPTWKAKGGNDSLFITNHAGNLDWAGPSANDKDVWTTTIAGGVTTTGWSAPASDPTKAPAAGNATGTHEFLIHWQPTAAGSHTIQVIGGDNRGKLIRFWMSAGTSIALMQNGYAGQAQPEPAGEDGAVERDHGVCLVIGAGLTYWPNNSVGCSHSTLLLMTNPTSKNLNIVLTSTQADDVYFYVRVDEFGQIPATGYTACAQDP